MSLWTVVTGEQLCTIKKYVRTFTKRFSQRPFTTLIMFFFFFLNYNNNKNSPVYDKPKVQIEENLNTTFLESITHYTLPQ